MNTVVIAHLYPDDMNIYGDSGNVLALRRRLEWRGYACQVLQVQPGQPFDFRRADIIVGGGGEDSGQRRIASDLLQRREALTAAAAEGMPMLVVCGLFQLFGRSFQTVDGEHLDGIGVFQAVTVGSSTRLVGNVTAAGPFGTLTGFENHSGQTTLLAGQRPLGQVLKGWGNNDNTTMEGAVTHNAVGTYLHGPVLPNNPVLADHLILSALRRRGLADGLAPLNDHLERAVAAAAVRRPGKVFNDIGRKGPSELLLRRWRRLRTTRRSG